MPFSVSPSVTVTELDQSSIIPQIATTTGAFVGRFDKGPVDQIVDISSEKELFAIFGKPSAGERGTDWWTCANFLNYSDKLKVVRVDEGSDPYTATGFGSGGGQTAATPATLRGTGEAVYTLPKVQFKEPGEIGNSLRMIVWPAGAGNPTISAAAGSGQDPRVAGWKGGVGGIGSSAGFSNVANTEIINSLGGFYAPTDSDLFSYKPSSSSEVYKSYKNGILAGGNPLGKGQTMDEVHVALIDHKGLIASNEGITGTVLEKWEGLSMWRGVYDGAGKNLYYKDVINNESNYIKIEENVDKSLFIAQFRSTGNIGQDVYHGMSGEVDIAGQGPQVWGTTFSSNDPLWSPGATFVPQLQFSDPGSSSRVMGSSAGWTASPLSYNILFSNGQESGVTYPYEGVGTDQNGTLTVNPNLSAIKNAYTKHFRDSEQVDVDLILGGAAGKILAADLIDIAEHRKDCVAFISPPISPSESEYNSVIYQSELHGFSGPTNIIDYRNNNNLNSSYAVMDSGWKYMFDSYNGIFRWVPLNADVAGLCARTENQQEAWFSPAGFNRGRVQDVVKLAINPSKAERDRLYAAGINPVVSFPGEGTVLFGDKTLQRRPSALDRINVRRLMIHLEKAIATAAKFQLFEFNDVFTRRSFVSTITPFLRRVQAQRGITDFRVVCDETNNTAEVVGNNQFVADIFIKPAMSINFINLNFVAVRQDATFTESTT